MARRGLIPATAVMVYAPRDPAEVDTALQVLAASYRFARGDEPRSPHPPGAPDPDR